MKQELNIITLNPLKFDELSAALNPYFDCRFRVLEIGAEIQGDPDDILYRKLVTAFKHCKESVLVDDTSLHLSSLNGFPGPYVKDFLMAIKPWEVGERFAGTRVRVTCRIGICVAREGHKDKHIYAIGHMDGTIVAPKIKNDNETKFDLFILPDGKDKTMIEYSTDEKNMFSHRGNAIRDLVEKLKAL